MTSPRSRKSRARLALGSSPRHRGTEGLDRQELVYGIPYAAFVNASFAYSKPREPNRFNASRGAWYAALEVVTCMREVAWHMADFLANSGEFKGVVEYAEDVRQHGRRVRRS